MKLLLLLSVLLGGCAFPQGSTLDLRTTAGLSKDGGSFGGKAVLHIPLADRQINPPGAPFALYVPRLNP